MDRRNKVNGGKSFVSLFTGGMGLDIGLEQEGFKPVVCNEIDEACIATIKANRPDLPVVDEPIENISIETLNEAAGVDLRGIDLVVGGPPCQAFSVYGNRLGIEDGRGQLLFEFIRLVSEIRPKVFLMENVRGLHSMSIVPKTTLNGKRDAPEEYTRPGSLLKEIIRRFEKYGYRLDCFLVNVVNYGAPQIRERLLCIGNRYDLRATFPPPMFSNRPGDRLPPFATLRDVIGNNFDDNDPTLMNFSKRKLYYLSMVPPGGNWRSLPSEIQKESMGKSWYLKGGRSATWRKLSWDFPSPTVVTMPNHATTSMCHPSELRALTVGECAAIQEFPKDWVFVGSPAEKYRQIGNAVPPRLGKVAGNVISKILEKISRMPRKESFGLTVPSTVQHIRPHVRTRCFWKNGKAYAGKFDYYLEEGSEQNLPLLKYIKT